MYSNILAFDDIFDSAKIARNGNKC
jgi:hypothetical protein